MKALLRHLLVALVLVNLAFVHITRAADPLWLLPLVALTVASPFLVSLRRFLVYRLLWNGAVVGVFALLVQHATTAGIQYMLEDGLLLAALCQVHLLNNIGADQKPDLIFFNSFLIAVVTSFLSLDLGYSLVFLLYAPILLLALQVNTLDRGGRSLDGRLLRRVLAGGAARAGAVLALTLLAFFFLPRDFSRRGLLGDRLKWRPGNLSSMGFDDRVDLDQTGRDAGGGDRVVMTVTLLSGHSSGVPETWRGATLTRFDGEHWTPSRASGGETRPWIMTGRGTWVRRAADPGPVVSVELRDPASGRIFVPLSSRRVAVETPGADRLIVPGADLAFRHRGGGRFGGPVRYEVGLAAGSEPPGGGVGESARRLPSVFWRLSPGTIPTAASRLAARLRREAGDGASQREVVERMRSWLSTRREWLPPGDPRAARTLRSFFEDGKGAHCEYFATALAVMLRSQGIPCRLVTGFRSSEWDETGRTLTVRDRHAHAWVEVHDPRAGWMTVDPSPPAPDSSGGAGTGVFGALKESLAAAWAWVTGFTEDGRRKALAWLAALPGRLAVFAGRNPVPLGALLALLAAFFLARRRRDREPVPVRDYRRATRRARLSLRPGETPRELLHRARSGAVPPSRLAPLEAATRLHEAARYCKTGDRHGSFTSIPCASGRKCKTGDRHGSFTSIPCASGRK